MQQAISQSEYGISETDLPRKWQIALPFFIYALQPIINIHSGVCFGYEALIRGYQQAGFKSIADIFNQAHHDGCLAELDILLRERAIQKYRMTPNTSATKLYFNLDSRIFHSTTPHIALTRELLQKYEMPPDSLCFEISERHAIAVSDKALEQIHQYQQAGIRMAIDDFGTGFSGFQLLYSVNPDYIKIDRFFINTICRDNKKKLFASNIINMAHTLGSLVIAEGVESLRELNTCRNLGCDLLQGFVAAAPETDLNRLYKHYPEIADADELERRTKDPNAVLARGNINPIPTILNTQELIDIFDIFRAHTEQTFFPVVNANQQPIGIIRESSIKDYTYSPYGKDLLRNHSFRKKLHEVIEQIPICEISTPIEKLLEIFSISSNIEGIIIVENMLYIGFLDAQSIIRLLHEQNLMMARDQNPLSKLPGNHMIYRFITQAIADHTTAYTFVYFDFDNFKPFNDTYGFRQGDRIIQLFADILNTQQKVDLIAHIGGDDFFMAKRDANIEQIQQQVASIIAQFSSDAESFYPPEVIQAQTMQARDRAGNLTDFPLLSVSAVIATITPPHNKITPENISGKIAEAKKQAKQSENKSHTIDLTSSTTIVS